MVDEGMTGFVFSAESMLKAPQEAIDVSHSFLLSSHHVGGKESALACAQ